MGRDRVRLDLPRPSIPIMARTLVMFASVTGLKVTMTDPIASRSAMTSLCSPLEEPEAALAPDVSGLDVEEDSVVTSMTW